MSCEGLGGKVTYVDRGPELGVVFTCVFAFAVPFWVVDMFDLGCKIEYGRVEG